MKFIAVVLLALAVAVSAQGVPAQIGSMALPTGGLNINPATGALPLQVQPPSFQQLGTTYGTVGNIGLPSTMPSGIPSGIPMTSMPALGNIGVSGLDPRTLNVAEQVRSQMTQQIAQGQFPMTAPITAPTTQFPSTFGLGQQFPITTPTTFGVNPFQQQFPSTMGLGNIAGVNPLMGQQQFGGVNPLLGQQGFGVNPLLGQQPQQFGLGSIGQGFGQGINPLMNQFGAGQFGAGQQLGQFGAGQQLGQFGGVNPLVGQGLNLANWGMMGGQGALQGAIARAVQQAGFGGANVGPAGPGPMGGVGAPFGGIGSPMGPGGPNMPRL